MSETGFTNVDAIGTIVQRLASASRAPGEGEYMGEDGFIHCTACGERKQTYFSSPILPEPVLWDILCACGRQAKADEQARREQEARKREADKLRAYSILDERARASRFESWASDGHNERVLKIARRYVANFPEMLRRNQGLLLYGSAGTGKTFAAACIANALMDAGVSVIMTSFVKLIGGAYTDEEQPLIDKINKAELLVIDDLGAERATEFAIERVYNMVDSRYRAGKPMILTTNLDMATMRSASDIRFYRIYDRVLSSCYPVQFTGPSWRINDAKQRYAEVRDILEG